MVDRCSETSLTLCWFAAVAREGKRSEPGLATAALAVVHRVKGNSSSGRVLRIEAAHDMRAVSCLQHAIVVQTHADPLVRKRFADEPLAVQVSE